MRLTQDDRDSTVELTVGQAVRVRLPDGWSRLRWSPQGVLAAAPAEPGRSGIRSTLVAKQRGRSVVTAVPPGTCDAAGRTCPPNALWRVTVVVR